MSKVNPNTSVKSPTKDRVNRLAGGYGVFAAKQGAYDLLRRAVLSCLLWEDLAYESGQKNADNIASLIPQVDPVRVADLAVEARTSQKLRHVPLFIVSEMLKHPFHKELVASTLPQVITRADQITDFVAIYWKGNPKKGKKNAPLPAQAKKGLAACFGKFSEYQLAKYDRDGDVKLRDVLFLTHAKPINQEQAGLFEKIASRTLNVPDTWEVALSTGKDKKGTWTRLIDEEKLGALAFLRNLRNMKDVSVDANVIRKGLKGITSQMLLPLNFFSAAKYAPEFKADINDLMLRTYKDLPKLGGKSIFIVDVSGSMDSAISGKSTFNRMEVAAAMACLAHELCEEVEIWCTAGSDGTRVHKTAKIAYPKRGLDLSDQIAEYAHGRSKSLGGGGIFTRQCLEYIKEQINYTPDRIMVFSDSEDCDTDRSRLPNPFGKNNYIVDVSAHAHGVNYKGKFTAEVSGWSESFLTFVAALEGIQNTFDDNE